MSHLWPLSPTLLGPLTFFIPILPLAYPRCFTHMVFLLFIYWHRVDFQCCANLCRAAKWLSCTHTSLVVQSCLTLCHTMDSAHQASLSIANSRSLLKLMSIELVMPSSHLILCRPLLLLLCLSQHQGLFKWVSSLHQVAKVLELQLHHQSFQWIFRTDFLQHGLVGSPWSSRDSQESSPTPQFKSINSSALSFLYSPTLTSIHDYWKNHNFDKMDLCWQSNVSAF